MGDDPTEGASLSIGTTDESGHRRFIHPSEVKGRYQRRKNWTSAILVLIFLILPWLSIRGAPVLLIDLPHRQFSILGIRFFAHDAPMVFFIAAGAAMTLAFVTSVWGRMWCGWACPQTVFVDSIFRRIERLIEGDAVTRRKLDAAPMSARKLRIRSLKWSLYGLTSLVISHSFLAYFVGPEKISQMMQHSPASHPESFLVMAFMTALVLFDFGWFREQFCTLICPYGRFQSVLMDEKSLAVTYDRARGEPRRSGDCVDCRKCVQVCPTGIDIRNGLQMECIACTACIDACDLVMTRLNRKPGLIAYTRGKQGLRPYVYLSLILILSTCLIWVISTRKPIEITFLRAVGAPYDEIRELGENAPALQIINRFKLEIVNQTFHPTTIQLRTPRPEVTLISTELPVELKPGRVRRIELFIRFPVSVLTRGHTLLPILTSDGQTLEVPLVGPYR